MLNASTDLPGRIVRPAVATSTCLTRLPAKRTTQCTVSYMADGMFKKISVESVRTQLATFAKFVIAMHPTTQQPYMPVKQLKATWPQLTEHKLLRRKT